MNLEIQKNTIRILQITATMGMGGIENFLMNIYRNVDRNKIQFDFVVNDGPEEYFEKEIKELGGNIYKLSSLRKGGHFRYKKQLRELLKKNNYKIVHSHYNAMSGIILAECKKQNIEHRIAHSHTAPVKTFRYVGLIGKYKKYSKNLINKVATKKFACSSSAGEWLYDNNNFEILKNGIPSKKYYYNQEKYKKIRDNLNIQKNEIVVGHVGSFSLPKNHSFIIKIFKELVNKNSKYKLVLIGEGEFKKNIEKEIKEQGLENNVILLGLRNDVKELLQGFDLFLFPSLFEGLPVTLVEAQASGLKCFISNTITDEIDLDCKLIEKISLNKTPLEWANFIDENKVYQRRNTEEEMNRSGYNLELSIKNIEEIYLKLYFS